jgi:hypothetical protein
VIENWRINEPLLGLTEPQWIGAMLIVLGMGGWFYFRARPEPETV